jgi:hypothetical protein
MRLMPLAASDFVRIVRRMEGPGVDPHKFDGMIQKLSASLSRRSLVGGALGASLLAVVGLNEPVPAKNKKNRAKGGACIPSGKQCPSLKPRGRRGKGNKKPKKLTCDQCCEGRSITVTNSQGKQVQTCGCLQTDTACTTETECCSNVCANGFCQIAPCAALGQPCSGVPGGGANLCCLNGPISSANTVFCNQSPATPATPGTCVACVPAGGACNPTLFQFGQCCGINVCNQTGPTTGTCGVPIVL